MATVAESDEKSDFSPTESPFVKASKTLEQLPWIEYAVQQAQFAQKTLEETIDSSIQVAESRFSEIRSTSSAHLNQTLISLELAGLLLLLFVTLMESLVQLHEHNENEKNVDDDKIRPWVDLPSELLNLIFSSLFDPDHISFSSIRDQFRFRLTSKGWQSKVPCLLGQFPFLMSRPPRYIVGAFTFFNPITNKEIQVFEEDHMEVVHGRHLRIHCSRFGWLLMSNGYFLFLYNPFIPGSTVELPYAPIPHLKYVSSMSFTAPPTSSDCIVYVHCMYDPDHGVGIYRWCYGEDDWTDYHIDCQLPFGQSCGNPIFYGSVFYQLNMCGRLGISDPKKGNEQHIWKDLPRPKPLKNIYSPPYGTNKRKRRQQPKAAQEDIIQSKPPLEIRTKHYMAECDGKLVMVRVDYRGCFLVHSLHVFELDWSRMEWVTVKSLGNKTMFICEAGSLLTKTNGGGAENKIYFPAYVNTEDEDEDGDGDATKKVGAFYCLENHKYNFPPVKWKRVINCTWIDTKFQL